MCASKEGRHSIRRKKQCSCVAETIHSYLTDLPKQSDFLIFCRFVRHFRSGFWYITLWRNVRTTDKCMSFNFDFCRPRSTFFSSFVCPPRHKKQAIEEKRLDFQSKSYLRLQKFYKGKKFEREMRKKRSKMEKKKRKISNRQQQEEIIAFNTILCYNFCCCCSLVLFTECSRSKVIHCTLFTVWFH